jgi:glucosamine--fructose-6-phosphate aminotransferase (isomerizing)
VQVIPLSTQEAVREKTIASICEVKARDALVVGVALEGDSDEVIDLTRANRYLTPVLTVIPLQLLAYYAAIARGADVDKPRNLAKSVTVEEASGGNTTTPPP